MHALRELFIMLALARVMAGETPGCDWQAKLAVAHVTANRHAVGMVGGWYGNADPTAMDLMAARMWQQWPDPTDGAVFLLGPGDATRLTEWLGERTGRWECPGTWVESYRSGNR